MYRDKREIWQEERTAVVFISEKLKAGQIRGIYKSLEKKQKQLRELQESLSNPRAKKRNKEELENKITNLLKGQFLNNLIYWSVNEILEGKFQLEFSINQKKLNEIEDKLGFRIIMTDRHHWSTVDIIKAYYGQSFVEHTFKNLKKSISSCNKTAISLDRSENNCSLFRLCAWLFIIYNRVATG